MTLLAPQNTRVRIDTDRTLLQRVIENILDSSLRHTPAHGRVSVSSRLAGDVEIAVSNTGPAIPRSQRGHIEVIDTQEWPTSFIVRLPAP
ncbi:MAG: ATP-binding protein [Myxococcota bacterium]|nr:ATP-binding protein [Myxococcota bacterium]